MELVLSALGVVVLSLLLWDIVAQRREWERGDQDERDRGELPYDYFKKERQDERRNDRS